MRRLVLTAALLVAATAGARAPGADPSAPAAATGQPTGADAWYGLAADGTPRVHLYFFWSHSCPHCRLARPFIATLAHRHRWLVVHSLDIADQANRRRYHALATMAGETARAVPGFVYCGRLQSGWDDATTTGHALEQALIACRARRAHGQPPRATPGLDPADLVHVPVLGRSSGADHSLALLTVLIAALDAFNPCAFFVLLFLLSLMIHGRSRARMFVIGGVFVFFSGLLYFLFMSAWLNLFLLIGGVPIITLAAGLAAVLIGALNVKDYFLFGTGPTLSIPAAARPRLFERVRPLLAQDRWPALLGATVVLALAANSYELLCTAGLPMTYTRILTLRELSTWAYYGYLALYNLVYVVPLLLIVTAFALTLGARKLSERGARLLKLLSGLMMLELGLVLVLAPARLHDAGTAALLIGAAAALTAAAAYGRRARS